jgi:hypothetical protein
MGAATALTAVAGGADILSGIFGLSEADAYSSMMRSRARLLRAENEADIARYAEESRGFKAEQSVKFLKAGVTLEGSPLEILDETARVTSENITAMRAKGEAEARALVESGRAAKSAARARFVQGIAGAAERTVRVGDKAGWWDKKTSTPSAGGRSDVGVDGGGARTGFENERYR